MDVYSNGYEYQIVLNDRFCEQLYTPDYFLAYQAVNLYHVLLSIISMASILYFIINFRKYLKFHENIEILFYFQFAACFMHAASIGAFQSYQLVTRYFAQEPCDVILTIPIYATFNVLLAVSIDWTISSLICMLIERTVASFFFSKYERFSRKFGIIMAVFAMISPVFALLTVIGGARFDYPQISAMVSPPNNNTRINYVFAIMTLFYILLGFHSIFLYHFNKKRNNSVFAEVGLRSRFQMKENVTSSRILWHLTSTQLLIYLLFGVSMYLIRVVIKFPRPLKWQIICELAYTPPMYCAIMPVLCIAIIRNDRKEHVQKINSLVEISSTGKEGWDNYQKWLHNQWA